MGVRLLLAYAFVAATLLTRATGAQQPRSTPWHPPTTDAEKALAVILATADNDENQVDNLFNGRGDPAFHRTIDYGTMLEPALISAIAAAEKKLVDRWCGGHYRDGELCGLEFLPIECPQDTDAGYLYRTLSVRADAATIAYRWRGSDRKLVATYRMILRGGSWKIDGIHCGSGPSFNMR